MRSLLKGKLLSVTTEPHLQNFFVVHGHMAAEPGGGSRSGIERTLLFLCEAIRTEPRLIGILIAGLLHPVRHFPIGLGVQPILPDIFLQPLSVQHHSVSIMEPSHLSGKKAPHHQLLRVGQNIGLIPKSGQRSGLPQHGRGCYMGNIGVEKPRRDPGILSPPYMLPKIAVLYKRLHFLHLQTTFFKAILPPGSGRTLRFPAPGQAARPAFRSLGSFPPSPPA